MVHKTSLSISCLLLNLKLRSKSFFFFKSLLLPLVPTTNQTRSQLWYTCNDSNSKFMMVGFNVDTNGRHLYDSISRIPEVHIDHQRRNSKGLNSPNFCMYDCLEVSEQLQLLPPLGVLPVLFPTSTVQESQFPAQICTFISYFFLCYVQITSSCHLGCLRMRISTSDSMLNHLRPLLTYLL